MDLHDTEKSTNAILNEPETKYLGKRVDEKSVAAGPQRRVNLTFTAPQSVFTHAFWVRLYDLKLNVWKNDVKEVVVTYSTSSASDCLVFDASSLEQREGGEVREGGELSSATLVMVDTLEQFKGVDKNALLALHASRVWSNGKSRSNSIWPVVILLHPDLKTHTYTYWLAAATFTPTVPLKIESMPLSPFLSNAAEGLAAATSGEGFPCLMLIPPQSKSRSSETRREPLVLEHWQQLASPAYVVIRDERSDASALYEEKHLVPRNELLLGWRLRNLLALLARGQNGGEQREVAIELIVLRGPGAHLHLTLRVPDDGGRTHYAAPPATPRVVGWELNEAGKPGPRRVDLAAVLDPQAVAAMAVSLNTQLLKWRAWPALDLDKVQSCRVLILGAGTLGCGVARGLVGWGVRHITFVDSGRVSWSNPSRQSLYALSDAERGAFKAEAAAEALRRIAPQSLISASAVVLGIPMPGHPEHWSDETLGEAVAQLSTLIAQHDAVFSLLDSREARWLPTLLCAAEDKLLITAALGMDTYLTMRSGSGLACYYCSDVCGVGNSQRSRAADQQCTVTRPGGSMVAAALAVELLVQCLQFGDDVDKAPHMVRGSVGSFDQSKQHTLKFEKCVCCSQHVLGRLKADRFGLISQVVKDVEGTCLTEITGIDTFVSESEALFQEMDD